MCLVHAYGHDDAGGGGDPDCSEAAGATHVDTLQSVSEHLPFVETYRSDDEWAVLSDRTRRTIVEHLAAGPLAVGELSDRLPVSRPAVSQHLKVLKDAGLVVEQAAGARRIYRLNPTGVAALRDQLDTFWARTLAAYSDAIDAPDYPQKEKP